MTDLERSREVRRRLAAEDPPEGWPKMVDRDEPVPKCSILDCYRPGIYFVALRSNIDYVGMNQNACDHHLLHVHAAALKWVRRR